MTRKAAAAAAAEAPRVPRVVGYDDAPSDMTPLEFARLRRSLGLSQVDLGVLLGVRGLQVSSYERGVTPISNRRARQLMALIASRKRTAPGRPTN